MFPAYFQNPSRNKIRSPKKPVSSIGRLPKNVTSPYSVRGYDDPCQIKIYKPQVISTRSCFEYDYKQFCKNDSEAFRLLLRNKYQLGKPKISLQNRTKQETVVSKKRSQNSFPCRKAPYVPTSFLNSSKKKKLTASLNVKKSTSSSDVWKGKEKSLVSIYPSKNSKVLHQDRNNNRIKNLDIKAENSQSGYAKDVGTAASCDHDSRKQDDVSTEKSSEDTPEKVAVTFSSVIEDLRGSCKEKKEGGELKRKITEEEFLEINRELLKDIIADEEDGIVIPEAECQLFMDDRRPSASHIMNEHLNHMLSGEKSMPTTSVTADVSVIYPSEEATGLDEVIAQAGMFSKCGINIEVIDEHGRGVDVHEFQEDENKIEAKEYTLGASSQRKEELKKLLEECTEIAKEIQDLELLG